MTYKVIIPVVNRGLAANLLNSIEDNTIIPDNILIIDNSMGKTAFPYYERLSVQVIYPETCLGVNPSWNLGISQTDDCDYVAILNDDVVLGKHFFEDNIRVFETVFDCGAVCPATVHDIADMGKSVTEKIVRMKKREGWAMSFRWSVLKHIPAIPDDLKTFCGDDWLWVQTHLHKWHWYKNTGNIVYHKVGVSVRQLGARSHLKQDKAAFQRMI